MSESMENKVFTEVAEDKEHYTNILLSLRLEKNELPVTNDVIEFYPEVIDKVVVKRKFYYINGKLDKVRLYV